MKDDIWSPFPSGSNEFIYLNANFDKVQIDEGEKDISSFHNKDENGVLIPSDVLDFKITVFLDERIEIIERTRYNVWDLLGDVGGFNDGLYLICSLVISTYSAFSFNKSIIENTFVDKPR